MKNEKLFVGGYYDSRIIIGGSDYFNGRTPFDDNVDTYTLEEALKLHFLSAISEWYEDEYNKEFSEISEDAKIAAISEYTESDEIAGLVYCETEEKAERYKQSILEELEEINKMLIYDGMVQDKEGYFVESYRIDQDL